jgi:16S rRNA (cytidine1402-2'-O)-methyltransferase
LNGKLRRSDAPGKSADKSDGGLAAGLYVTATPIGNAADITLRALGVLRDCDLIAAEDTRVTQKLLSIHGLRKPLTPYNDHNAARERPKLLAKLRAGGRIALVSDAGTPLVSDPGFKLVREAVAEGLPVHALPGASAVMTGLALAGLPTDRFLFAGFLPAKQGERRGVLAELKPIRASLVFFESAQRLADSLADMAKIFGVRTAAVARELTKLHEEVRRGLLTTLAEHYAAQGPPKGEVTVIVSPPHEEQTDPGRIDSALGKAMAFMPLRAAVDLVAEMLEAPRRLVYDRALAKKRGDAKRDDG